MTDEKEPETLAAFIARLQLVGRAVLVHAPLRAESASGDKIATWRLQSSHYVYTIMQEGKGHPRAITAEYWQGSACKKGPTLAKVLDSLANDASAYDQTFEEWADECGYDSDSRAAERTYNACRRIAADLRALLGAKDFQALVSGDVERP